MHKAGQSRVYIHTVHDRMFGDFPARNTVYTQYIFMVLAKPRHAYTVNVCCIWRDILKQINIYSVRIYNPGQPTLSCSDLHKRRKKKLRSQ